MEENLKQLLLKDLCARLPYLPIVEISIYRDSNRKGDIELDPHVTENIWELIDKYHAIPYLRPMSSMTEEEEYEYHQIRKRNSDKSLSLMDCSDHLEQLLFPIIIGTESIDWLNRHHFDYRGLIEKGLAVAVTKENNPYEK